MPTDIQVQVLHFGQNILKFNTPKNILSKINSIYEKRIEEFTPWNKHLAGKIKKEHSLFNNTARNEGKDNHNFLDKELLQFFSDCTNHYLSYNKVVVHQLKLTTVWINEMVEHEYNPVHVHAGDLLTGLSSVMILKLPESFGKEVSREDDPSNGRLQFLGNGTGQFANVNVRPELIEGDFYMFPYDIGHCVYPFTGKGIRRTLSANIDIYYNAIDTAVKARKPKDFK